MLKKDSIGFIIVIVLICESSCTAHGLFISDPRPKTHESDSIPPISPSNKHERAFVMIKPDGVERRLIGKIIERFENKGLKLVAFKIVKPSVEIMEKHYREHAGKSFYPQLIKFMTSGPVVPMVWEGSNAVQITRKMIGKSDPELSLPGQIRNDFSVERERNIIHGAHDIDAAKREISLWFKENELVSWTPTNQRWIYV